MATKERVLGKGWTPERVKASMDKKPPFEEARHLLGLAKETVYKETVTVFTRSLQEAERLWTDVYQPLGWKIDSTIKPKWNKRAKEYQHHFTVERSSISKDLKDINWKLNGKRIIIRTIGKAVGIGAVIYVLVKLIL